MDLYEQVQLGAKLIGNKVYFNHQEPKDARLAPCSIQTARWSSRA